jgi:glycosyltransferase involved in cell wall biosynthesis
MHLLILGYEYPPIGGGTGQALHRLLEHWPARDNWEIEVWTAAPPANHTRHRIEGILYREFACGKKDLHFWKSTEQALLLWKTWRRTLGDAPFPDAILVWGGWPLGVLLLGALGQVPSVFALRGSDVPGFNRRTSGGFWRFLSKAVWKRASALTANSPSLARLANQTQPRRKIHVIPNGVVMPLRALPEWEESPPVARPWQILSVNRLVPRKRVEWLIQALGHLAPDVREQVRVKIAGEGPERYRLETMARELNVHTLVQFLGEVPSEEMAELYRESDVFVLASEAEGLSNALLEAMAHGLPTLLSSPTGFSDIDSAVILCDRPEKIAQHLRLLFHDPRRHDTASAAAVSAASEYSWDQVARIYADLLRDISQRPRLH